MLCGNVLSQTANWFNRVRFAHQPSW